MAFTMRTDGMGLPGSGEDNEQRSAYAVLEALPGIDLVSRFSRDGSPRGNRSYEEETIAAEGLLVGLAGERLADLFGIGKLLSAGIEAPGRNFLLIKGKDEFLAAVGNAEPPRKMEERIRSALSLRKGKAHE